MTLGDLIKKKDYDYISVRMQISKEATGTEKEDIFVGVCYSRAGHLFSGDGDTYSVEEEILGFEEWESKVQGIKSGLTVTYSM